MLGRFLSGFSPGVAFPTFPLSLLRLKNASSLNKDSRPLRDASLSGMGAARTATCARKETASNGMINIYAIEWGVGLKH